MADCAGSAVRSTARVATPVVPVWTGGIRRRRVPPTQSVPVCPSGPASRVVPKMNRPTERVGRSVATSVRSLSATERLPRGFEVSRALHEPDVVDEPPALGKVTPVAEPQLEVGVVARLGRQLEGTATATRGSGRARGCATGSRSHQSIHSRWGKIMRRVRQR